MKKNVILLYVIIQIVFYQNAFSNDYLFDSTYAFNGSIKSIYSSNGINYIGGSFTKISYITGFGTILDNINGNFLNNFPKINGRVNIALPDGNGGFYIGGEFTKIGNDIRLGLAQIDSLGQLTSFAPKVNMGVYPYVYDMILYNNKLYVCGSFEGINNIPRKYIACINLDGTLTNWDLNVNDEVATIDAYNNTIYFGGNFTSVKNQTRYFVAAADINGNLIDWNPQANNNIRKIKIYNGKIYIGGMFTRIQNITANRFVAMYPDGSIDNLNLSFNNAVEAIDFYKDKMYIGGRFTKVNNSFRSYLASIDTNGTITNWDPQPNAKINVIECDSSGIYIGGSFSNVLYQNRSSFAKISYVGNLTNWNPNANSTGLTIASTNNRIFVGGIFNGLGGQDRNYLAAIDNYGNILNWNPNPNNEVYSIFGYQDTIYISGTFTKVCNINIAKFASINKNTVELTNFRPNINGYVYSLIRYDDRMIIAGSFTKINNQNRTYIASFDNNGNLMDFAPQINSSIFAMDQDGANLYIGGFFNSINGQERNNLACIDTSGILKSFNPNLDNAVLSLKYFKDKIYVGGWFNNVAGVTRTKFAVINKNGSLSSLAPNPNNAIWSILTFSVPFDVVYLGGDFSSLFNQPVNNLAAIDVSGGLVPWYPNPDKSVFALSSSNSLVYAGGLFLSLENTLSPNFAVLNTYNTNPSKPTLISPANNSVKVPVLSEFNWSNTEYTSSYRVQFATDNSFNNILVDTIVPINYLKFNDIKLEYDTKIYWRVRSLNSGGQSVWSSVWSFTTRITPPIAPILVSPNNNDTNIAFGQNFEWNGNSTTAQSYQIQFSDDINFNIIISSDSAITIQSKIIPDILMQPLKTYYWRVRGINESGPGEWSDVWFFTTAEFFIQSINLKIGWNLISSNILPNNDSLEKIFEQISDKILIVKNSIGQTYIPQYNINTIGKWNIFEAYRVYSLNNTALNIIGYAINPATTTYNLKQGWNMISYNRSNSMDATIAFESLVDTNLLLLVKDDNGRSYIPEYNINQIGDLEPGKGYIIFMKSNANFNYPPNN